MWTMLDMKLVELFMTKEENTWKAKEWNETDDKNKNIRDFILKRIYFRTYS